MPSRCASHERRTANLIREAELSIELDKLWLADELNALSFRKIGVTAYRLNKAGAHTLTPKRGSDDHVEHKHQIRLIRKDAGEGGKTARPALHEREYEVAR